MTETSLLLGAGFSVNKGYPTANELNGKLINIDPEDFFIDTDGTVYLKERTKADTFDYDSYFKYKFFVVELFKYFVKLNGIFDYEKCYDYYENKLIINDVGFKQLCNRFRKKYYTETNNQNLLSHANKIFNQLVSLLLVDNEGKRFYESCHYGKPIYTGYTGFLNCLETWGRGGITHIHTLNHDIFFESLNYSDWLQNNLCDGFKEGGSPYYGKLKGDYFVRLKYFSNEYKKNFRLYKLHGSLDQYIFHLKKPTGSQIEAYVKIKEGIRNTELYKEIKDGSNGFKYVHDWLNYHPDFLSGTTSKILRYREPMYYEKVFANFEKNLSNSCRLIIFGYSCGDDEINNIIEQKFDFKKYPIHVIDPYPSSQLYTFVKKYNATIIKKSPNDITLEDFL